MSRTAFVEPPVAATPANSSRKTTLLSAGILAAMAFAFWSVDGILLVRLRAIANDAFKNSPSSPVLTVDDVNDLNAYSPARLAKCLSFPSIQVRTIVCLALGHQRGRKDPESWAGVLPTLLRSLRESNDHDYQYSVVQALLSMSYIPPEDADMVLQFADEQLTAEEPWWNLCAHLLNVTADSQFDRRPQVLQAFERSMVLPTAQFETTRRLARLAPESQEAAAAVRLYTRANPPSSGMMGTPEVRDILIRQTALADELLDGTTNQKLAVFSVAADDLGKSETVLEDSTPSGRRPQWLTNERLERIHRTALDLVKRTTDPDAIANPQHAFRIIWYWRDGSEQLFEIAKTSIGKRRALAFWYAVNNKNLSETRRFLATRMTEIAPWLKEGDADVQRSLLRSLQPCFVDSEWVKSIDPTAKRAIVAASRRLLDKSTGRDDLVFLSFFANASTAIDSIDADRVAGALVRALDQMKGGFERTNYKPQGVLDDVHKRLFERLADHRGRESVQRAVDFRRSLEAEGVIGVRTGAGVMMNDATSLYK